MTEHEEILTKIFGMLTRGVADRKSPLHTPVLATIDLDGSPQARTVVLRKFLTEQRVLIFHTDIRAPKSAEIMANPTVSWLFYHPGDKIQFRISGRATIHSDEKDELKLNRWQATWNFGRRCYMGEAPSRISENETSGMSEEMKKREPTSAESEIGFPNFAVVATEILSIDCLELYVTGHRRSHFTWNKAGELETNWLTP